MKFGTGKLREILSNHYNFHIQLKNLMTALHSDPHASLRLWAFASLFCAVSNTLSIHAEVRNIKIMFCIIFLCKECKPSAVESLFFFPVPQQQCNISDGNCASIVALFLEHSQPRVSGFMQLRMCHDRFAMRTFPNLFNYRWKNAIGIVYEC